MERTLHLAVTVTPDLELGGFVARAVDVEVASQGETEDEALAALTEALELYLEDEDAAELVHRLTAGPSKAREIGIRLPA
ncbi:type II toxin-antitoxin system HicB family antitoxin [Nocardiopsis algeriensis]|uniref:Putative RNase H-like HicB family nuclease n=1 Tax=Nocardiopsis algeriensis TaxID=1478215 RepID=A0A841IVD4_9ACTN|nr:type II toxin-antitoxin system HicB family antitoxin [Nocardiopsis algeriensis]MBB6122220.1 putative RNase H-like HicB family nuclease [Nocardiopsis algeriensis]